jgi:membrane-associated phospholipid phosphatase
MIENIYQGGIQFVMALQGLGSWLAPVMLFFSNLGSEVFFLVVAPAFYWSIDATLGLRLGLFLMTSLGVNSALKLVFHTPRPYWYTTQVKAFTSEATFGIPSGHAQNAVIVWGTLAYYLQRTWICVLSILFILFIGLSRIYLGVHFPTDVVAGWLVGLILLWVLIKLENPILRWLKEQSLVEKLTGALTVSLLIILVNLLVKFSLRAWSLPSQWIENAKLAFPNNPIDPLALSGAISSAGTFFGLAAGAILIKEKGGYYAGGEVWKRVVRYVLGLIGMVVIYYGLSLIFPQETILSQLLRYLRYGIVGFWLTYLAPLIFIRLDLATQ